MVYKDITPEKILLKTIPFPVLSMTIRHQYIDQADYVDIG